MKLLENFKELTIHPKNAEELKKLILNLALKGKLTKGFNKNRLKNDDKVKGYFDIPNDWYWDIFDSTCDFYMGKTPPSKRMEFWEGEYPWISIADMKTYETISSTKKQITELGLNDYFKGTLVKKGTLIMSFKLSIGKTSILGFDACHNEAIISIYPYDFVLKEYLFLFLPIISNWGTQVNALMGNTLNKSKIQNLKVPIPPLEEQKAIVSIVNQLFKEVDELEAKTKERVQLKEDFVQSALRRLTEAKAVNGEWAFLQEHFKSFFNTKEAIKKLRETFLQLAVQGKLTHHWRHERTLSGAEVEGAGILLEKIKAEKEQLIKDKKIKKEKPLPEITEDEIPYELPEGWCWCRAEDILSFTGGVAKGKRYKEKVYEVPYLRVANVQRGNLDLNLVKTIFVSNVDIQKYQLSKDDLLMIEGGDPDKVGRCAIWQSEIEGCIHQNHVFRVRQFLSESLNSLFLMLFINSPVTQAYYLNCAKRTTNLASINKTQMRGTPIALPPLEEQKVIVSKVNSLMALCDNLEQEIAQNTKQVEDLMKSCLREVFEED